MRKGKSWIWGCLCLEDASFRDMFLCLPQSVMDRGADGQPEPPRPLERERSHLSLSLGACLSGRVGKKVYVPVRGAGL